jgi:hypothetical protein
MKDKGRQRGVRHVSSLLGMRRKGTKIIIIII